MAFNHSALLSIADTRIPLTEGWELVRAEPGGFATPDALQAASAWLPAVVPGTVALALDAAGQWSWSSTDPIDAHDWWYRCRFPWDADGAAVHIALEGLATIADVWLNGVHLLHSDNMFVRNECDITSAVQSHNELMIRFTSMQTALCDRRSRPRWRSKLVDSQNLRWFRTTLLGHIPGWSPTPRTVGPWRGITLVRHGAVSVMNRRLCAHVAGTDGVLDATIRIQLGEGVDIARAALIVGGTRTELAIDTDGTIVTVRGSLTISDVALWWPHTHGEQSLYGVIVRIESSAGSIDLSLGRIGFRRIEHDTYAGNFAFRVNGRPVFCRGACWSTVDALGLMGGVDDYRSALTLARDAGMNMLRVGGTMVYEAEVFYDLCDELGILIWQDLMFANMDYPDHDAAFVRSVTIEVAQLLSRLHVHPSLALLCGNSEVEQQAAMLGMPRECWSNTLFSALIPSLVAEHSPGLAYWPSSPSGGVLPFHVNAGDAHYFGYGPYLRHHSDVRASAIRFASETLALSNIPEPAMVDSISCGSPGAGHHPAWKSGVPRDNEAGWDFEDVRDHYVASVFKVDPVAERYADPERYLSLGRAAGGELVARTIGEWRRAGSGCNGALIWFYRDLRPGAGWGLLDARGHPKAAYYYFRRASLPVGIFISDEGLNGLNIHVANDSPENISAELRVALYRAGTTLVGGGKRSVVLNAGQTIALCADELLPCFTDSNYAYRFGPPNHDVVVATLVAAETGKHIGAAFHFPSGLSSVRQPIVLSATAEHIGGGAYSLRLQSNALATAVAIEAAGFLPDDNYFNLEPAVVRTVMLRPCEATVRLSGRVTALNAASATRIEVE